MDDRLYTIKNRILSAFLALTVLMYVLPVAVFAAENETDIAALEDRMILINGDNLSEWDGKTLTGTNRSGNQYLAVSGVTLNLTIKNLTVNRSNEGIYHYSAVSLENGAVLNLTLEGNSTLTGYSGGAGISVPEGCTLNVTEKSTGSLTAVGGNSWGGAAGIGAVAGNYNLDYSKETYDTVKVGKIVIAGGTVTAVGGTYKYRFGDSCGAAGIGGSYGDSGAVIEITGGTVNAAGGAYAAGIGGGFNGSVTSVTISGGTVIAEKGTAKNMSGSVITGKDAAAIGNGYSSYTEIGNVPPCGEITVTNGTVTANGNIGYGDSHKNLRPESGGSVAVSGGRVDVVGKIDANVTDVDEKYILCHYSLRLLIYADDLKASSSSVIGTVTVGTDENRYTDENVSFTLTRGCAEAKIKVDALLRGNQPITVSFGGKTYGDKTVNLGYESTVLWGVQPELKVESTFQCKYTYNNGFLTVTGTESRYAGRITITMADGIETTSHQIRIADGSSIELTLKNVKMDGGERSTLVAGGAAKLTLILNGENSMKSNCHKGKVVDVSDGELTVKGAGSLSVENTAGDAGRDFNAGIWANALTVKENPTLAVRIYHEGIGLYGSTVNILGGTINVSLKGRDNWHPGYGYAGIGGKIGFESTINISGGTIYADGGEGYVSGGGIANPYTQAVITGGNVNMNRTFDENTACSHKQPKNDRDALLYCAVITLGEGNSLSANAKVTGTRIKVNGNTYTYKLENTFTDGSGKMYLWLPKSAVITEIRTADGTYTGECTVNTEITVGGNRWGTSAATFTRRNVAEITDADGTVRQVPVLKTSELTDGCTVKLLRTCYLYEHLCIPENYRCTFLLGNDASCNIAGETNTEARVIAQAGSTLTVDVVAEGKGKINCGTDIKTSATLDVLSDKVTMDGVRVWTIGSTKLTHGIYRGLSVTISGQKDARVADLLADGCVFKDYKRESIKNGNVTFFGSQEDATVCPADGHTHIYDSTTLRCTVCGVKCRHTSGWTEDYRCNDCGYICTHENVGSDGRCTACGKQMYDPTAISVDIAWEEMTFSYNMGKRTWDPDTHTEKQEPDAWENDGKEITVTNNSRRAVQAKFKFGGSADAVNGIFDSDTLPLPASDGVIKPVKKTVFRISGAAIDKKQSLGFITVTIAADSPDTDNDSEKE